MAITNSTRDGETIADMNTTPLIDVMLVLLTLLIITLPLQSNAVKIGLPHPGPPPPWAPVVAINVDFDGALSWNGTPVGRAALDADLARAAASDPQPEIRVRADRLAKYNIVALVLADAQRLGVRRIGLANMGDFTPGG